MNLSDRVGVVLAGGRSSRFGSDKFFHLVEGKEMGLRAVGALSPVVDRVLVVGRHSIPEGWGATAVFGSREGSGPLGAILDAAEHSRAETYLVMPCDMPFLGSTGVSQLSDALSSSDRLAAFATMSPQTEPQWLAAAWNAEAIHDLVEPFFQSGGRSVRNVAQTVPHVLVSLLAHQLINVNELADV
jgi:molybdopterin-guanine dinucleotide biosynthesis protein A